MMPPPEPQPPPTVAAEPAKSAVERFHGRIRNNPLVASLIVAGTIVIAVASFTDAATKLIAAVSKPSPAAARTTLNQMGVPYTPDAFVASAGEGDATVVKLFLTAGMDPDATGRERSALGAAAFQGRAPVAKLLLDAGASVVARRDGRPAALVSAAAGGHDDLLRLLLDRHPDQPTLDAAFLAAMRSTNDASRDRGAMRLLAARGANVASLDADAIAEALYRNLGDQDVAGTWQVLIDLGLDLRRLDATDGKPVTTMTPLMRAALDGHPATVRLLLAHGAAIDARFDRPAFDEAGWTPLLLAIRERHPEVVEVLVEHGANVEPKNSDGDSALLLAAKKADAASIAALLAKTSDLDAKDADGRTALIILAEDTRWPDGMMVEHPEAVRALLDRGARVDLKDTSGRTALMIAAQSGSTTVVGLLLDKGARVDDRDARGLRPVDYARKGQDPAKVVAVIQLLQKPVRARGRGPR